ncbi:MAG TPA: DUF3048 domain-containing protein, partial [Acidimicrobiia bacterium]|nr:DUF3048 domain-containing protein [Acidimicrobiia bacterium]
MRRPIALAGVLLTAACSGSRPAAAPPTSTGAPSTARQTSTTVVAPSGPPFPLTGLPSDDPTTLSRPALSIKVDNAPAARPQAGLNAADVVTEELVEGGLTRFFATYQSQDAPLVGPVRSGRLVDADLLRELGGGIFAYSGAAAGELAVIRASSGALLLSPDAGDAGFHRDLSRPAPSNLFTATPDLYRAGLARSPSLTAPPPLFTFDPRPPAGGPGSSVAVTFSGAANAVWSWSAATGSYSRVEDGSAHLLADGQQVTATDVVIMSVGVRPSGFVDVGRNPVPAVIVIGSGPCWVLRDGIVEQGRWQRADP